MSKVVLLDRDGVINRDSYDYIKSVDEFIPIPESIEAIAQLTAAGYQIGIATNQSGVSRGYYTEEALNAINNKLKQLVKEAGGNIAALEYCMHMPDAGCMCRKPQPGMLLKLANYFQCELKDVPFVGDRISDIQAAITAGAKPVVVLSQMTDRAALIAYPEVETFDSLSAWVSSFL